MVAFDGSAETALNVLSVALSGSKETVRVVVFPFATVPDVGVTLIAVTGVILLRSSATEGLPTLVTFTVRVITSFAVTALPILLIQPRNTSTVPFGKRIL
ncbi:hypothetical protein BvCmsNSP010_01787 [Escherichia coli]|nr:hypothetical protein BvCmsNSP010_01787 [Escherichia coli]